MSGEGKIVSVTGASGYIASWLVKLLLQRGYTVKATVRNLSQYHRHLFLYSGLIITSYYGPSSKYRAYPFRFWQILKLVMWIVLFPCSYLHMDISSNFQKQGSLVEFR